MNVGQLKQALPILFKSKITPLIIGAHGVGKSQCIKQYADENGYKLIDLRIGQMADAGELVGLADFDRDEAQQIVATKFFKPHFLNFNKGDKVIVFLDEINRGHKDILQAVFQLVYDGCITLNGFELGENMHVVAAMNPPTDDYAVLDFSDAAFADRFCHIKFEPTVKDWLDYASETGVDPSITGFIGRHNGFLDTEGPEYSLEVKPSRRSMVNLDKILKNSNGIDDVIFQELAVGTIGIEAATTYFQDAKDNNSKIEAVDVLNNFKKVKKLVEKYSANDTNRHDILQATNDEIEREMKNLDTLTKAQEENLSQYIVAIPKDLSYGFVNNLFEVESFMSTESDKEEGLAGDNFPASKRIISHFESIMKDIKVKESDNE